MTMPNKKPTLAELAAEGPIMRDVPGDEAPEEDRKGLPSEGVTANAAANAMHAGGATGLN